MGAGMAWIWMREELGRAFAGTPGAAGQARNPRLGTGAVPPMHVRTVCMHSVAAGEATGRARRRASLKNEGSRGAESSAGGGRMAGNRGTAQPRSRQAQMTHSPAGSPRPGAKQKAGRLGPARARCLAGKESGGTGRVQAPSWPATRRLPVTRSCEVARVPFKDCALSPRLRSNSCSHSQTRTVSSPSPVSPRPSSH